MATLLAYIWRKSGRFSSRRSLIFFVKLSQIGLVERHLQMSLLSRCFRTATCYSVQCFCFTYYLASCSSQCQWRTGDTWALHNQSLLDCRYTDSGSDPLHSCWPGHLWKTEGSSVVTLNVEKGDFNYGTGYNKCVWRELTLSEVGRLSRNHLSFEHYEQIFIGFKIGVDTDIFS